jgi:hypothetical protein
MAKIDDRLDALQQGFQYPTLSIGTTWVEDAQMEQLQVRRRNAGQTHHRLFYLSLGETNQQPTTFWGYKFTDALEKAEKSRGTYVKHTKGPRKAAAAG